MEPMWFRSSQRWLVVHSWRGHCAFWRFVKVHSQFPRNFLSNTRRVCDMSGALRRDNLVSFCYFKVPSRCVSCSPILPFSVFKKLQPWRLVSTNGRYARSKFFFVDFCVACCFCYQLVHHCTAIDCRSLINDHCSQDGFLSVVVQETMQCIDFI